MHKAAIVARVARPMGPNKFPWHYIYRACIDVIARPLGARDTRHA